MDRLECEREQWEEDLRNAQRMPGVRPQNPFRANRLLGGEPAPIRDAAHLMRALLGVVLISLGSYFRGLPETWNWLWWAVMGVGVLVVVSAVDWTGK